MVGSALGVAFRLGELEPSVEPCCSRLLVRSPRDGPPNAPCSRSCPSEKNLMILVSPGRYVIRLVMGLHREVCGVVAGCQLAQHHAAWGKSREVRPSCLVLDRR